MEPPACPAPSVLKDTRGQLEPLVLLECLVMESLGSTVRKERQGPPGPLEPQGQRVSKVLLVTQGPLVPLDPPALQDHRGLAVSPEPPALWVLRETLAPLAPRELRDTREIRELRDPRASRDTPALQEPLALRDPQVLKEIKDM